MLSTYEDHLIPWNEKVRLILGMMQQGLDSARSGNIMYSIIIIIILLLWHYQAAGISVPRHQWDDCHYIISRKVDQTNVVHALSTLYRPVSMLG